LLHLAGTFLQLPTQLLAKLVHPFGQLLQALGLGWDWLCSLGSEDGNVPLKAHDLFLLLHCGHKA
jgi:hypothetical protein